MRRRRFLASTTAALSAALAGCAHPAVVLDMNEATADDIAGEVSLTADPGSEEFSVVRSARENGSATRSGRHELFDRTDAVRVEDAFYEVSETRLASSEVMVYEVLVDFNPDDSTAEVGEIDYDDLPEADRQRLAPLVSEDEPPSRGGYDVGVDYGAAADVGNESVFVPERQYDILVHGGNRYRVAVNSRTATEAEYRYEVTEVASSVEAFADQVRDRYLFTLSGLSEAERAVVEEAVDGAYFQDDDAFGSITDHIREHEGIDVDDSYGTWLLEYERTEYLTYAEW